MITRTRTPPARAGYLAHVLPALAVAATVGCEGSSAYLPAGATVPSAWDDAELTARIDAADHVEREVWLVHAFAEGAPATYWNFGTAPDAGTMPLHRLCRREGTRCVDVDHPYVLEHLPGDPDYRSYGRVHTVAVTDRWSGERFPSRQAIDDGVRDGLLEAPRVTNLWRHCPVVHRDVRVEVGEGAWVSPVPVYAQGVEASCVDFAATHGDRLLDDADAGTVLVRNVYILTRQGDAGPLHEVARGEDLTGDGDTDDSNAIFGVDYASDHYTPAWSMVTVTVPATYASIDTAMDETIADYRAAEDMFTIDADYRIAPIEGRVVAFEETGTIVDCPLQSAPGAL